MKKMFIKKGRKQMEIYKSIRKMTLPNPRIILNKKNNKIEKIIDEETNKEANQ